VAITTREKATWTSRAVSRPIDPGSSAMCVQCGEQVKFRARLRLQQIICNVYDNGRWVRVEHFHAECYPLAGEPHGSAAL
jgi:hypothetical protein